MIGTWVGAGIGIIALIGIVGPVLVFLASRTERHKTLSTMGAETNGYISPGWHLGPNIFLGQRIKAPDLRERKFDGIFNLDTASLKAVKTDAHWVHFGVLLEAYGMTFARGGDISIKEGKTYLPVHPSWILAIGILGRYSSRRVWQGGPSTRVFTHGAKFLRQTNPDSTATPLNHGPPMIIPQLQPRDRAARYTERDVYEEDVYERREAPTARATRTSRQYGSRILYGTTGSLEVDPRGQQTSLPCLILTYRAASTTTYSNEMKNDVLPIDQLFLLSIGLLKIRDGLYVSLADSQPVEELEGAENEYERRSSDDAEYHNYPERERIRTRVVERERESTRSEEHYPSRRTRHTYYEREPSAYRLGECNIAEPLVRMGKAFMDFSGGFDCIGFSPEDDRGMKASLSRFEENTYVPADHNWVRVEETYIPRADAQRMAIALLDLPWSSQGYLIGGEESGVAMTMFKAAAKRLRPMMERLQEKVQLLDLTSQDKQKLSTAMDPVLRRLNRVEFSRDIQIFRKLYELNTVLLKQGSPQSQVMVDQVVAILSITNEEFREIVHASIRAIKESETTAIDFDLKTTTLKVPSAFGVKQHFQVDWDAISNTTSETRPHETVLVKHTAIVLASLRGLVLCMMLLACSDAEPLLELVGDCGDLIYID